ncbi:hypothetical protein PHLCEN_2v1415 [Hermanssonia centrifuga]|uniref:Peptidase S33 tripeptidyl aminopeptidase-like C-terminal domain-containing protein n=1 Tax=Hermanssonia centrifuga TaxID=98765 RepID=A0A2R6S3C6_9APHY|nr:hypothetical protein PHLCEN_2v1415 [Hermanssonia centrifuga]
MFSGVEDSEDYYAALWSNNLVDTDAVLDWFFESCAEAGPEACALHESSAEKIKSRLNSLYESLKYSPIPVSAKGSDFTAADYGLVDYALVRKLIFGFLYAPYPGMRPGGVTPSALASALAAAENGNGLPLWDLQKNGTEQFKCKCGGGANPVPRTDGATVAIACGEGDVVEDSIEELQAHYEKMSQDSTFAELWTVHASCVGWKIRTVERFNGPFVGNTSHPVLLIGNTADPVTPLRK